MTIYNHLISIILGFSLMLLAVLLFCVLTSPTAHAATTTIKIYPHNSDGYARLDQTDNKTTWSAARDFTGTISGDPHTSLSINVMKSHKPGSYYQVFRTSIPFDTSSIPDNATIVSAAVNVYRNGNENNTNNPDIVVVSHDRASSTVYAKADWNISNFGTTTFARSKISSVDQYNTFTLNSNGREHIDQTGYTVFGMLEEHDFDNSDPGGTKYEAAFVDSSATGTSTDPYLEVTYTTPDETTVTVYAHNSDGYARLDQTDNKTTWSAAHDFTGTISGDPHTSEINNVMKSHKPGSYYQIFRTSIPFDTSVIPSGATITGATLGVFRFDGENNTNSPDIVVVSHDRASSTVYAKADWNISNFGTTTFARNGITSEYQFNEFELNSSGLDYINDNGYTTLGLLEGHDFDNSDPGGTKYEAAFFDSDTIPGSCADPYLEITYYE